MFVLDLLLVLGGVLLLLVAGLFGGLLVVCLVDGFAFGGFAFGGVLIYCYFIILDFLLL